MLEAHPDYPVQCLIDAITDYPDRFRVAEPFYLEPADTDVFYLRDRNHRHALVWGGDGHVAYLGFYGTEATASYLPCS